MKFIGNIDLNKNELQNARIQNLATAPSSPVEGQVYYNTVDKKYYGYNGTMWVDLGQQDDPDTKQLKISSADTTEGYLESKIVQGTNITITKQNTGGNENLKIDIGTGVTTNTGSQTLTNKTINADSNTISNLELDNFKTGVIDTDLSSASASDDTLASAKAIKAYIDQLLGANDAMVYKGVINCSTNPNYPAGNKGDTYRISVAGKIGGASGINVEVGDMILCITDNSVSGDNATVGANWNIIQTNIDGAVIGDISSTDHAIARFNGTTGRLIQTSLATIDDLGSINLPSGQSYKINNVSINTAGTLTNVVYLDNAQTITGNKTFSGTINLSALTASYRLETDASKNIVSVAKGTADNKNFETSTANIKMNGTVSVGTSSNIARADHTHPSDTSKVSKYATNFGDGAASQFTITHNLGTTDVTVNIWDNGTKELVGADIQYIDVNSIKIITGLPIPTLNQYRVVVNG